MNAGKGVLLDGVILNIFPTETYGNFEKRVFWMQGGDKTKYGVETWAVEMHQGKGDILDNFKIGDSVTVTVDIKGRAFKSATGKESVFVTLKATDIQKQGKVSAVASSRQQTGGKGRYSVDSDVYNDGEPQY